MFPPNWLRCVHVSLSQPIYMYTKHIPVLNGLLFTDVCCFGIKLYAPLITHEFSLMDRIWIFGNNVRFD